MINAVQRETRAQKVLSYLPFTLFFPIGIVYTGFLLFLIAWVSDGNYRARWQNIKSNPMLAPIVAMSAAFTVVALYSAWESPGFRSGFAHYQKYLILLLLLSVGAGAWQERAIRVFVAGALFAATVYYLTLFDLLPATDPFTSYVIYGGNKSILLGILLAIAAGLMFYDFCMQQDARAKAWRFAGFLYICGALVFISKGRSGHLIFLVLIPLVMLKLAHLTLRTWAAAALGLALLGGAAWQVSDSLRHRVTETISDVERFSEGKVGYAQTSTGIRLKMYSQTLEMIADKPLQGFGIASWEPTFFKRYGHTISEVAVTPHNDYLLYAAEGGLIGLGALLFVWLAQLRIAMRMREPGGMWLTIFTVAIMVGGMFNAILRDGVFAMAFMILLAIPLAGAVPHKRRQENLA